MIKFSVIVPVYNRIDEVSELLHSLLHQTCGNFEVIVVEDGSTMPCRAICEDYQNQGLDVKYFYKENEGRSISRNVGMKNATGDYFIFFDSDCVIIPDYFEKLNKRLEISYADCFGGPDDAHSSFSDTQKAINFSMTSFLTTGGIRGGKVSLEKFTPRTFNMGFSREVYEKVGGFREMFSEDIDMSKRIEKAGFRTVLFDDVRVWHKRRVDFKKFFKQVHVFGQSRITLQLLYPGSLKLVHTLPAIAIIAGILIISGGIFLSPWLFILPAIYALLIFTLAYGSTNSVRIAFLAVPASVIQIFGYGSGFLRAWFRTYILRRKRDINKEIEIRKGK